MADYVKDVETKQNTSRANASNLKQNEDESSLGISPPPFQLKITNSEPPAQNQQNSNGNAVVQKIGEEAEEATENAITAASHARTIHEAVDGPGTDESAIFSTLNGLSRDQVKLLKRTYQSVYGNSLLADLRDDLTDEEMRIALIFMHYWPVQYGTVLGSYQHEKACEKLLELPGYSLNTYSKLIDLQPDYEHRAYVAKALAAGNPILDIIPFAYRIYSKDHEWLENNLRLTRQSDGRGLQQSWNDSCGPTTAQAIQGELDPIYALNVRENNPAIDQGNGSTTGPNSAIATDQRNILESEGGVAVERGASGGNGMGMTPLMRYIKDRTGVDYEVVYAASDQAGGVDAINGILAQGLPVPIRVARVNNTGGHFVLITNRVGQNYNIHDVWAGSSFVRSRADFTSNTMNIANWPSFRHYGRPK